MEGYGERGCGEFKRHADRHDVGLEIQVWPRMSFEAKLLRALCNRTKYFSNLQRTDRKSLALFCALVGQLNKLNDRGGFLPFDSQLRSFSDARSEILVQFGIRSILVRRPAANTNQLIFDSAEMGVDTCRLLTI